MTRQQLNAQTIEWIRTLLDKGENTLICAIAADATKMTYSQVVGYGVSIPLLENAMDISLEMLVAEAAKGNPGQQQIVQPPYNDLIVDDLYMIAPMNNNYIGMVIQWSAVSLGIEGIPGHGQLEIRKHPDESVTIDHEAMSKEFCIALMTALIEKYYK